ncbi:hypothetical protein ANN_23548 [Periplaneta americana]|uniref:Uncharacterized protein n=1 Tax=Periplaneta americana TaxID=6978 RepID=A0ABQ8SMN1_PERAM|nr:hypothetical protein ANN_23548 [Periplaneta americana]
MELNNTCEQYGMKKNADKTINIMVIGRKIMKVNVRIENEVVDERRSSESATERSICGSSKKRSESENRVQIVQQSLDSSRRARGSDTPSTLMRLADSTEEDEVEDDHLIREKYGKQFLTLKLGFALMKQTVKGLDVGSGSYVPAVVDPSEDSPKRGRANTSEELRQRITNAAALVTPQMTQNNWREVEYRLDVCRATQGAYIELHSAFYETQRVFTSSYVETHPYLAQLVPTLMRSRWDARPSRYAYLDIAENTRRCEMCSK